MISGKVFIKGIQIGRCYIMTDNDSVCEIVFDISPNLGKSRGIASFISGNAVNPDAIIIETIFGVYQYIYFFDASFNFEITAQNTYLTNRFIFGISIFYIKKVTLLLLPRAVICILVTL